MPSSESQARLIRDARCGLNPARESDRPQFFEAHGTGTPAGDRKLHFFAAFLVIRPDEC
jgi:acyl transferase domain-containing protein